MTKRQYRQAYNFYDSLRLDDPALKDPDAITEQKRNLGKVSPANIEIIERQDSLQRIAACLKMKEKICKKIGKATPQTQGLKDEGSFRKLHPFDNTMRLRSFLQITIKKANGIFIMRTCRQKGLADFKAKWGNRPNADNWRRSAALANIIRDNKSDAMTRY